MPTKISTIYISK